MRQAYRSGLALLAASVHVVGACSSGGASPASETEPIGDSGIEAASPTPVTECGDAGGVRKVSQMPSGACRPSDRCTLLVWHPCPCAKERAGIDGYECRCDSAAWRCTRTGVGATACQEDATCQPVYKDASGD